MRNEDAEEALDPEVEAELQELDEPEEPKPEKKRKSVLVPKVQSMDNFFIAHYRDYVIQQLNEKLVNGELNDIAGVTICSERILPGECCFRHFNYWRINRTDFYIQIDLRLELQVETTGGADTDFIWFYVLLWFSFGDDDTECDIDEIGLLANVPDFEGYIKLDKYLVPVLRRDEVDKYSEEIWDHYDANAAKDGKLRSPRGMADKMHLSIMSLNLYKSATIHSTLFLCEGSVLVQPDRSPGERKSPPPETVKIPAMTIVLNTRAGNCYDHDLDIYHECIHNEWHYLFYRLQDMQNNDARQLTMVKRSVIDDDKYTNPIEFIEWQARYGSFGLMMPERFMRETITSQYQEAQAQKRKDGTYDHDGWRYESIGRYIANNFDLSKARVRARMLQLGYVAAKGALNYVDGRYITPFAFSDHGNARGGETYVIDRNTVALLYQQDKEFQRIMQTGLFSYVDGHVVYCDSGNAVTSSSGTRLSGWANAHIDQACLRFTRTYTRDHAYTYTFGSFNNEEAVKNTFRFLDLSGKMTLKEAEMAKTKLMEEMPLTFHGALAYIMKGRVTVDELVRRIPISRRTLLRLRTEERKTYNLDQIIAICIGLHLPPWLSEILLEKAHLSVQRFGPFGYYGTILDCFYMDSIDDVQEFLKNNGYEPLNLNFEAVAA